MRGVAGGRDGEARGERVVRQARGVGEREPSPIPVLLSSPSLRVRVCKLSVNTVPD